MSHHDMLLRSTKGGGGPTRIDVGFKGVAAMKLQTLLRGLSIREAEGSEAAVLAEETGTSPDDGMRYFVVESGAFRGYVVAGLVMTEEDEGEYYDPSAVYEPGLGS